MKTRRVLSRICSTEILLLLLFSAAPALASPQVEAAPESPTVSAGSPFNFTVTVSWEGEADRYIIVPPDPAMPDGLEKVSSRFASSASARAQRMRYSFVLKALQPGDFTIPPVVIRYWEKGAEQESTTSSEEVAVRALRFAFSEKNMTGFAVAGSALVAAAAAVAALMTTRRRKKKALSSSGPDMPLQQQAADLLQACRQGRLAGDHCAFYTAALALARLAAPGDHGLLESLAAKAEQARYGALQSPSEEAERILKRLEKEAAALRGGAGQNELDYRKYCK